MAESKTFGVKVPEELHQEAAKLQKEFGTGEEFLQALIASYKSEKTKEHVPAVAQQRFAVLPLINNLPRSYLWFVMPWDMILC